MSPTEIDRTLALLHELESELSLILTINARHLTAFDTAKDYSEVIGQHGNAGLFFVAGNPAYLSEEERRLHARDRLTELVTSSRDKLPSAPIFVGSEGLHDITITLSRKYSVVPFVLLDSSAQAKVSSIRSKSKKETGVYCPCHLSADGEGVLIKAFGSYALRRGWVREALRERGLRVTDVKSQLANGGGVGEAALVLGEAIRELVLCGSSAAEKRLTALYDSGVGYAALLPAQETAEEARDLESLTSRFCS